MNFMKLFTPRKQKTSRPPATTPKELVAPEHRKPLYSQLQANRRELMKLFGQSVDFHVEQVFFGKQEGLVCYLDSMCDSKSISNMVTRPLSAFALRERSVTSKRDWENLSKALFPGTPHQFPQRFDDVVLQILNGFVILLLDGSNEALSLLVDQYEIRKIEEPSTQTIVRGPKDGFVENVYTNMSLIRRRVKNPNLRFQTFTVGKDTNTTVMLAYIDGVINQRILEEVQHRLKKIHTSFILDSGNIEEFIQDQTFTPFPTVYNSERPDTAVSNLLEGKAVILVDGSPFALMAPTFMTDFFTSSEDYYQAFYMASFIRMVRYASFMLALMLPAVYVAVLTYHHELIPTTLLISLAAQREGVPFPAVIEVLLMELTFEIIREAGIRMPRAVGQAVSIVGALVIGQAAVEAGIVSNTLIIVVSLTGLSSFASPVYSMAVAIRLLRFFLILLASIFGLYGMVLGLIFIVAHLTSLRSMGAPYLAPVAPMIIEDQDDVFVRFPFWAMKERPKALDPQTPLRQPKSASPSPPTEGAKADGEGSS